MYLTIRLQNQSLATLTLPITRSQSLLGLHSLYQMTAMHVAAGRGHKDIVEYLAGIRPGDINSKNSGGVSACDFLLLIVDWYCCFRGGGKHYWWGTNYGVCVSTHTLGGLEALFSRKIFKMKCSEIASGAIFVRHICTPIYIWTRCR